MIDPNVMDQQLNIDRAQISNRYKKLAEQEVPQTPQGPGEQYEEDYEEDYYPEDEQMAFVPPNQQRAPQQAPQETQEQRPPSLARPGKAAAYDQEIFPGGPLESEIIAWKKQHGKIYRVVFEGDVYIFRRMNRFEYKQVMSVPNTNELLREEMIAEVCTLFPYDYGYDAMANGAGGIPSLIAENVMKKSGFSRNIEVAPL